MEEITKKIFEYKTNYWFRDLEYEKQLQKELQEALLADFYKKLGIYMILSIIKWIIITTTLNYLVRKFCRYFTYITTGKKEECWKTMIFFYIFVTPYVANLLIESIDLYKEKYW